MDPIDRRMLLGAAGLAGVAAMSKFAGAGPLNPPAGPVTPTGQTLDDIYNRIARTDVGVAEPRIPVQSLPGSATAVHVITEPGSYYLTGNIQGEAGKDGILIASGNVSIDLCGFALIGVPGSGAGVRIPGFSTANNVAVRNGNASGWGESAVDVRGSRSSLVEALVIRECGPGAIWATGCASITRCIVWNNNGTGIQVQGDGSNIMDCVVRDTGNGIVVDGGRAHVSRNSVCFAALGVAASSNTQVIDNQFSNCGFGITTFGGCHVERNSVTECVTGIDAGSSLAGNGDLIKGNRVSGCTTNYRAISGVMLQSNVSHGGGTAYDIAPGASHGPIVNVAGVGDISAVPGANHPWANFIY